MAGRTLLSLLLLVPVVGFGCKSSGGIVDMSDGTIPCNPDGGANMCPADLPFCHPMAHICVGCSDDFQTCDEATYGPGMICDPTTHTCVPGAPDMGCTRPSDCPRPGVDPAYAIQCEVELGICVGCVSSNDCVQPQTCDLSVHMCVNP